MASFFGDNATLRDVNVPAEKISVKDQHGRVRVAHDQITLAAILAANDVVNLMELPAGAKVFEVEFSTDDLGSTGVIDVGWEASADGGEVADANGFFSGLDVTSVIARQKIANTLPGFLKTFSEKVRVQLIATTATTATAGVIKVTIYYVVD